MKLKHLINESIYGTIGYISCEKDLELLEQYIVYNTPVLKEFKQIIIATNYKNENLIDINSKLWKKYFPDCILLDSKINRGHNFGTADLDNIVFDWCKNNNETWLCKLSNDVILQESLLDKEIIESDFYYLNGISYEDLHLVSFNYDKIYKERFFPHTNFYFINVSKCDFLNDKNYLDETYRYSKSISNYNNKIWEYVPGWSCELFLKNCVERNKLSKQYLLNQEKNNILCQVIETYNIGDPSHKNIMVDGICHFHYPEQPIIEI